MTSYPVAYVAHRTGSCIHERTDERRTMCFPNSPILKKIVINIFFRIFWKSRSRSRIKNLENWSWKIHVHTKYFVDFHMFSSFSRKNLKSTKRLAFAPQGGPHLALAVCSAATKTEASEPVQAPVGSIHAEGSTPSKKEVSETVVETAAGQISRSIRWGAVFCNMKIAAHWPTQENRQQLMICFAFVPVRGKNCPKWGQEDFSY